jgi:hypothetical protein
METYTLTFGNRAENHKGMEIIGEQLDHGLTSDDMNNVKKYSDDLDCETIIVNLNDLIEDDQTRKKTSDAKLLIVKNGINKLVNVDKLFEEQQNLEKDTQAYMYGRIVNKKARHNLCFSDFSQVADFENKKGTVYNFKDIKILNKLRRKLGKIHHLFENLQCEGNYYYDINKTYIGFHGDSEREIVIGCRLGESFPLYYQWYYKGNKVGKLYKYSLDHGDIYFMSDKAVGRDWKKSNIYTLRHAAGFEFNVGL